MQRLNHTGQRISEVSETGKTLKPYHKRGYAVINNYPDIQGFKSGQSEHDVGTLGDSRKI